MSLRQVGIGLGIGLAASAGIGARPAPQTPREELARLQRLGPHEYVNELFAGQRHWDAVLYRIGSGDRGWLLLAQRMKPGADAAASEELRSSIATALLHQPANALRILTLTEVGSGWPVRPVCAAPFPSPGKAWLIRYRAMAIKAVTAVGARDLRDRRNACLRTLRGIDLSKPAEAYD